MRADEGNGGLSRLDIVLTCDGHHQDAVVVEDLEVMLEIAQTGVYELQAAESKAANQALDHLRSHGLPIQVLGRGHAIGRKSLIS